MENMIDSLLYILSYNAHKKGVEVVCYKFVSDQANDTAYQDWAEMVAAGEQHYINQLEKLAVRF